MISIRFSPLRLFPVDRERRLRRFDWNSSPSPARPGFPLFIAPPAAWGVPRRPVGTLWIWKSGFLRAHTAHERRGPIWHGDSGTIRGAFAQLPTHTFQDFRVVRPPALGSRRRTFGHISKCKYPPRRSQPTPAQQAAPVLLTAQEVGCILPSSGLPVNDLCLPHRAAAYGPSLETQAFEGTPRRAHIPERRVRGKPPGTRTSTQRKTTDCRPEISKRFRQRRFLHITRSSRRIM